MEKGFKWQITTSKDVLGKLHIESGGKFNGNNWKCEGSYGESIVADSINLKKTLLIIPIPGYENVYDYYETNKNPFEVLDYAKVVFKNITKEEAKEILRKNLDKKENRKEYILFPNLTDDLITILEIVTNNSNNSKDDIIETLS